MKYVPHDYQRYVTNYIETHPACAVLLDMRLGKTSITLTALLDLLFDTFEAHRILVIAPLRVARDTWPAEIEKWDHLKLLTYSVAVGSEKDRIAALMRPADIYIINRENVQWLVEQSGIPFDFDTVIVDELSSFKSHQSKRFKALMQVRPRIKRIVGLTGTPSANGLMDLWAEFKILDMGERLGRFIGIYRNNYFTPDKRNGQIIYSYKLLPGADKAIYKRISDITISMKAADHLKMPELVMNNCVVDLSDDERERYGSKVWHSNSKYRKVIWRSNHKYDGDKTCRTPHLTDDEIQAAFLKAVNKLLETKDEVIANGYAMIPVLFDTTALKAEHDELLQETQVVSDMVQQCIYENAHVALDQAEYQKRYDTLTQRFDKAKARLEKASEQISQKQTQRANYEAFLKAFEKLPDQLPEFTLETWHGLVDYVTVYAEDDIRFTFKNGQEVKA